jgi:hypothetical protein
MKTLKISAIFICILLVITCMMAVYADTIEVEEEDEGDDIAYVPAQVIEYEGYEIGADGIGTIIALAAVSIVITAILMRRSIKAGAYNIT